PQAVELRVQFALLGRQARRDHDPGPYELIAGATTLHARHAVARQPERPAAAGPRRHLHRDPAAQRRHFYRCAQRRLGCGDRQLQLELVPLALEQGMRRDVAARVQAAARAGAAPAFARHPHTLAGPHPGGNLHLELPLRTLPAAAVTRRARLAVHVARAVAGGAGFLALEAEGLAGAVEGFLQRDLDARPHVVTAAATCPRPPPPPIPASLEID